MNWVLLYYYSLYFWCCLKIFTIKMWLMEDSILRGCGTKGFSFSLAVGWRCPCEFLTVWASLGQLASTRPRKQEGTRWRQSFYKPNLQRDLLFLLSSFSKGEWLQEVGLLGSSWRLPSIGTKQWMKAVSTWIRLHWRVIQQGHLAEGTSCVNA